MDLAWAWARAFVGLGLRLSLPMGPGLRVLGLGTLGALGLGVLSASLALVRMAELEHFSELVFAEGLSGSMTT